MPDTPSFYIDDDVLRRERQKARTMRHTQWWKRRCAKGVCHYCGQPTPARDLTMDHIVPLARGGRSTKGNLVPACKDCNNRKKHLLPMEWDRYIENLRKERP